MRRAELPLRTFSALLNIAEQRIDIQGCLWISATRNTLGASAGTSARASAVPDVAVVGLL